MKKVIGLLLEAVPQIIATLIATGILGIISILFKNQINNTWFIVASISLLVWLTCIYFSYTRDEPRITVHKLPAGHKPLKGPYKYPALRLWALRFTYIIPSVALVTLGVYLFVNIILPPEKTIILVADFDGPEPQRYRVTETIVENLQLAFENQYDISIQRTNESYDESVLARNKGEKERAAIIIWGWYGVTNEASTISVNFDIMNRLLKDYTFCSTAKGEPRVGTRADLERYSIQTDLSDELIYLTLFAKAMANYVSGNHENAISDLNQAIEITPDGYDSWPMHNIYHLRGEIYRDLGEFGLAVNDFDEAIKIYDDAAELYFDRGETLRELENFEAAIADWNKYLTYVPDDVYVLFEIGSLNYTLGFYEEAVVALEKGLTQEPNTNCAIIESGYSYYFIGAYDKAINKFNYAIDTGGLAEGYFGRGIVFYSQNEYEQAIIELTQSIEAARSLNYYFPAALEYRAYSYLAIGEKEDAIKDLLQFLEIVRDPNQDWVSFYRHRDYEKQELEIVEEKLRTLGIDPDSP